MGPGIAAVLARAGMDVALHDVSREALERARPAVEGAAGVLDMLGTALVPGGKVRYAVDLADALAGVELIIEAVPERLEIKQRVHADYERLVAPEVILATNTSGIPVTRIAAPLAHPERVVGMHWSNPPHLIPMIEVIPGEQTSDATCAMVAELIEAIGYVPCRLSREVPGFVENRILYAILRECLALVDAGVVSLEELDRNVQWGIGYKLAVIPPMQLLDMAGLDVYASVAGYLNADLSASAEVSQTVRDLTARGRLGIKTTGGIFDYTQDQIARLREQRARQLVAVRKALGEPAVPSSLPAQ